MDFTKLEIEISDTINKALNNNKIKIPKEEKDELIKLCIQCGVTGYAFALKDLVGEVIKDESKSD